MRYLAVVFFVFYSVVLLGQEETIATDRPTQSAGATVLSKGVLQVESGFLSEKATSDLTNLTYANFLFRYGLIKGLELRVTQNYVGVKDDESDETLSGMSPLTVGTKVHLVNENGLIPQMSVIGQVTLKTGDENFQPSKAVPEVRLNFANTLSDKLSLGYNVGMAFPEDNSTSFYSAVLGYGLGKGWTLFAEPYGFFADGNSDHRFNTGLIYLLKNNLQFDVAAGWGLSDTSPDSYLGFGASFMF